MLPRRRGRLLFYLRGKPSGSPRIDVTYLGLKANQPHLRLDIQLDGNTHRMETTVAGRWEAGELLDRLPDLRKRGVHLELEVLDANQESVRLRIITLMGLAYEGEWDVSGLHMVDVFTLSDSVRHLVSWIMRQGEVGLAEAAAQTHQSEEAARTMLDTLVEQGFVRKMDTGGLPRYRPLLARKRGHQLPRHIWRALDEKVEVAPSAGGDSSRVDLPALARRARDIVLSERGRFLLSTGPELTVFLLTEWLLLTGTESFTGVIGFAGVIGNSLLSGIFPVLLLVSSRRKGEFVPGVVFRLLGHPFVITSIYLLFLGNLFLHGLVIWDHPLERAGALIVGLLVLGVTITMMRGGAFARRVVVELREELRVGGRAVFAVTVAGQPTPAEVQLQSSKGEQRCQAASGEVSSFSSLRSATFRLPAAQAKELKVWAHRVTPEGDSEGLPALVEIHSGSDISRFDLKLSGGQVVLPVTSGECWLRITLPEKDSL